MGRGETSKLLSQLLRGPAYLVHLCLPSPGKELLLIGAQHMPAEGVDECELLLEGEKKDRGEEGRERGQEAT